MGGVFNHKVQTETANFVHNADKPSRNEFMRILPVALTWCALNGAVKTKQKPVSFNFRLYCQLHL